MSCGPTEVILVYEALPNFKNQWFLLFLAFISPSFFFFLLLFFVSSVVVHMSLTKVYGDFGGGYQNFDVCS